MSSTAGLTLNSLSYDYDTTEDFFDNYLDQCILNEREKQFQNLKTIKEQKVQEKEEDKYDIIIGDDKDEEEKSPVQKSKIIRTFFKMKSYRPDGAWQNEIEDKNDSWDSLASDSPTAKPQKPK